MSTASQLYHVYPEDAIHLIDTQIGTANYLFPPVRPGGVLRDYIATSNEEVWRAALPPAKTLRAGMRLTLKKFLLFDWFPRAPGLYFTEDGRRSRAEAQNYLRHMQVPRGSNTGDLNPKSMDREFLDVYDPYGKIAMLKGGVGCVHLRAKLLESGKTWFLSASSTGVAHEGFPVALPNSIYQEYFDTFQQKGALRCTLRGELEYIPETIVELSEQPVRVPQLYLQVNELIPFLDDYVDPLLVSVGISFLSGYEGPQKMYASYATFDARESGSLEDTANWLDEVYVRGLYHGEVVTDFDEEMRQFKGAIFSMSNIMENCVDRQQAGKVFQTLNLDKEAMFRLFSRMNSINFLYTERIEHMEQNRTINIGSNATVSAPVVIADEIRESFNTLKNSDVSPDLAALLEKLLSEVTRAAQNSQSPKAENALRDVRNLAEEVTAKESRAAEGVRLGERIKDWAQTIGAAGKPVVELIAAIVPLLPH